MIRKHGFTLIELLVVIAIIALLLSILMPALQKIKEQARIVVCKSNLKQLGVAFETYSASHEGKPLLTTNWDETTSTYDPHIWPLDIAPYLGENKYRDDPQAVKDGIMKIIKCPSAKSPKPRETNWGSDRETWEHWISPLHAEGSYGLNCWLAGIDLDTYVGAGWASEKQVRNNSMRDQSARSNSPLLADSCWFESVPMDPEEANKYKGNYDASVYPDMYPDYTGTNYDDRGMSRHCIDRHKLAINIVFADAHAEKVMIKDLWSLKWSKSFDTTAQDFKLTPQ